MKRLCFGIYASVLRACVPRKNTRLLTPQKQLVGVILLSVNNSYDIRSDDYTTSRLLSCNNYLSAEVTDAAKTVDSKAVSAYFSKKVIPLLDPNKVKLAVLALLDIITNDVTIDEDTIVNLVDGTTKRALLTQSDFVLGDFLAGTFLYVASFVENTVGKSFVEEINENYIQAFVPKKERIRIVAPHSTERELGHQSPDLQYIIPANKKKQDYLAYLRNAKSKYSTIKTLLYNDQPRPFYDFYVCNDIVRKVPVLRKPNSYYSVTIRNATVKSISESSRFIIITGAGGLGKSMMMRHLLLNAIDNYADFKLIPVFIPLKDFDESANGLFEYILSKMKSLGGNVSEDDFREALASSSCLLLFDGLDEIGMSHAKRFERELEEFADTYPSNCFVISSRPYQSFISYSRFSVLRLQPFSKTQALELIDNLEFRPDDPSIKEKFSAELDKTLFLTHRAFTQNPLLLTIMLMTFERFAEIPSKMHIFYREAFMALSVTHDASKGAYKRALKTGLSVDSFADCFAEICFRSYREEKFDLSEAEFEKYFCELGFADKKVRAQDFLFDLCSNMCLMYQESGRYHFTHRSFQEYFCAWFFSKQKDKFISKLGDFFEKRRNRMYGDQTFNMLCDLIPEKVEEFIFIPYLESLFDKCDRGDGYWEFLKMIYPCFYYKVGEVPDSIDNSPKSFLFDYLLRFIDASESERYGVDDLPQYSELLQDEYVLIVNEDEEQELVSRDDVSYQYRIEHGTPDTVGWYYEVDIATILDDVDQYEDLLKMLDREDFTFKLEYIKARELLNDLKAKQKSSDDCLLDLL